MTPGDKDPPSSGSATNRVAALHARFARAALFIYVATAGIALAMLAVLIASDRGYHERELRDKLLLETQIRAHYLSRELGLLVEELRRLGLRSEIDVFDRDSAPEQSLLRLAHEKSTFFNVGVAVLDDGGNVVWSEPREFLPPDGRFGAAPWFRAAARTREVAIVPVEPDRADNAVLYVVSPVVRDRRIEGVLLGAIDLARSWGMDPTEGVRVGVATVLADAQGAVVYPPKPPAFASEPEWSRLFAPAPGGPLLSDTTLTGAERVVAAAPVADTALVLMSIADRNALFGPSRARMRLRLATALSVALLPFVALVLLFAGSLRAFRKEETQALREERLRLLGEAAGLIAHEVKNSLNTLRMGTEMIARGERGGRTGAQEKALGELRRQIERMSEFTTGLLAFSKGIVPRPTAMDLAAVVREVASLARERAQETGAVLDVDAPSELGVRADPSLVHVVVANLIGNALDALLIGGVPGAPRIEIAVGTTEGKAWVRVGDNGPGISEAIRDDLFEPFVSGKPSGVGIGLALSRKIARAHGGDLVLEAPPPRGARFLFTLPREGA